MDLAHPLVAKFRALLPQHLPVDAGMRCAFLSGSTVEGVASLKPDFDFYAIVDHLPAGNHTEIFIPTDGVLIELTLLKTAFIHELARRLTQAAGAGEGLELFERLILHRVLTGMAVVENAQFEFFQKLIDRSALSQFLMRYHASFSEKCLSDAIRNLGAGDVDSAIFNADRSVHHAMDSFISQSGSTSTFVKWRNRYAERHLGKQHPVYTRYMELAGSIPTMQSQAAKIRYVECAARFTQTLADSRICRQIFAQTEFVFNEERLWGVNPMRTAPLPPSKRAFARIVQKGDKVLLNDVEPRFQLLPPALAVWLAVDNATLLADMVSKLSAPIWGIQQNATVVLDTSMARFRAVGAIH